MKVISGLSVTAAVAGICLMSSAGKPLRALSPAPASPVSYWQDHDDHHWDEPPSEFDEVRRRGFHDGMEGARKDYDNHRAPDPHNRDEFRHPHVPEHDKMAYREGFERGYQIAWNHFSHGR